MDLEQMRMQAAIDRMREITMESRPSPAELDLLEKAIAEIRAGRGVTYRDRLTGKVLEPDVEHRK